MTLSKFQLLLKKVNPKLNLRIRSYGDIVGLFAGMSGKSGYLCRLTKGELNLHGFRAAVYDSTNILNPVKNGNIKKRGRKTVINILRNWRWVKTHQQRSMLLWGNIKCLT